MNLSPDFSGFIWVLIKAGMCLGAAGCCGRWRKDPEIDNSVDKAAPSARGIRDGAAEFPFSLAGGIEESSRIQDGGRDCSAVGR